MEFILLLALKLNPSSIGQGPDQIHMQTQRVSSVDECKAIGEETKYHFKNTVTTVTYSCIPVKPLR